MSEGVGGISRRRASSRGHQISFEDVGSGPGVILVPGFFQSAADWVDAGYVDELAKSRRVLAMDPLGHGFSDKPYDWRAYQVPEVAADVVGVMDAAGVEQAVVWGYSRGAGIATQVAVEYPDRVSGLIVGATPMSATPEMVAPFIRPWVDPLARKDWSAYWEVMPAPIPEEDRHHVEEQNDPVALAAVAEAMCESHYTVDLNRIMAPRFLYCGGDDFFASLMAPEAEALGVTLHIVDGADHMGCFNRPQDVMPEVLAFLSALDGSRLAVADHGDDRS